MMSAAFFEGPRAFSTTPRSSFRSVRNSSVESGKRRPNARTPLLHQQKFRRMSTTEVKRRASMGYFPNSMIPNFPNDSCKLRGRHESSYWTFFDKYVPFLPSSHSMSDACNDCQWKRRMMDQFVAIRGEFQIPICQFWKVS